ncbi:MAG: hypothetical protein CM15mP127_14450 [Gammaproteobacteria bacterium]|nr:MAG: hypothetical protein CM15mP127_14450 [Gammaproteobacteria bacterium]
MLKKQILIINKNILLSETAKMNSNPQLVIDADDVKCSHGSSTGELDPDALFYLQSEVLIKIRQNLCLSMVSSLRL